MWIFLGSLLFILGTSSLLFVNSWMTLHSFLLVLFIATFIVGLLDRQISKLRKVIASIGLMFALSEIVFLFHYHYILLCINAFASILIGSLLVISQAFFHYKNLLKKSQNKYQKAIAIIESIFITALGIGVLSFVFMVMLIAVKPSIGIGLLIENRNSYEPLHEPDSTALDDGTVYINDIQYGDTYPRSFLDIYISNHELADSKPTYIYVHGGGFVQGDKTMGNPHAKDNTGSPYYYFLPFMERGYNVVSINYAFSPEYTYPIPIFQLSEAIEFLNKHADEYGLDMTKVIIGGNSAGGHIAGQFALIQTSKEYSQKIEIEPVMNKDFIKAVVLNSALLEPNKFDESIDSWSFDYQLSVVGRAYWGNDFETNASAKEANIIEHLTNEYPPVFITDGNTASFYEQAKALDKKLDELGVEHVFNFYEKNEAILTHSYETAMTTKHAFQNMDMMFEFLETQLSRNEVPNSKSAQ